LDWVPEGGNKEKRKTMEELDGDCQERLAVLGNIMGEGGRAGDGQR